MMASKSSPGLMVLGTLMPTMRASVRARREVAARAMEKRMLADIVDVDV